MPTVRAEPLAERPRGRLHPRRMAVFGMARRQRSELAEVLELVERHVGIAGEVEHRVEQHRAVPGRQHEAIAVRPFRIGGVECQELREQHGGDIGGAHRQPGMTGIRLFDGVHREPADRIGHSGVVDLRHDENPPEMRCLLAICRIGGQPGERAMATGTQGWIASVFRKSKAMKRTARPKSCFAVHSSAAALRWPRLPRKFLALNACLAAHFLSCGYFTEGPR